VWNWGLSFAWPWICCAVRHATHVRHRQREEALPMPNVNYVTHDTTFLWEARL
jgi:hypothetical protein